MGGATITMVPGAGAGYRWVVPLPMLHTGRVASQKVCDRTPDIMQDQELSGGLVYMLPSRKYLDMKRKEVMK